MKSLFRIVYLLAALQCYRSLETWLTSCDKNGNVINLLEPQTSLASVSSVDMISKINIDTSQQFQRMIGFGAGIPQSSATVLNQLKAKNISTYWDVLNKLFGSEGANMNFLRFPIGSCDFSLTATTYDEVKDDYDLSDFALDKDSEIIAEVLLDVKKVNSGLRLIAAPWSAPSWLKVYGTLTAYNNSNTLLHTDAAYSTYSQYLGKAMLSFRDLGLAVDYLAVQNEPLFGTSSEYPGMFLSADDSFRLNVLVRSELDKLGLSTQLLSYDHNWDHPEYPLSQLASAGGDGSKVFGGVAWHCYGGDMSSAQDSLHAAYPDTLQLLTECTGAYPAACDVTQGMTGFGFNHEWDMQNLLLGGAGHWSSGSLKWILALDEECGPTLPTVTFNNGRPLVSITSSSQVFFNQDYWSIAHMSKFLSPRVSVRVKSEVLAASSETRLLTQSFVNPATGQVVCIVMNLDHDNSAAVELNDAAHERAVTDSLPPFSTKIYVW